MVIKYNSMPNGSFSYVEEESFFRLSRTASSGQGGMAKFIKIKYLSDIERLSKTYTNNITEIIDERIKFLLPIDFSFFHFIKDCIGRVANAYEICLKNNYSNYLFIFPYDLIQNENLNFLKKYLKNLKIDYIFLEKSNYILKANKIYYEETNFHDLIPHPSINIYETCKELFIENKEIKPFKKVYLTRRLTGSTLMENDLYNQNEKIEIKDGSIRPFTNIRLFEEEKIENFFEKNGFEIICPENTFNNIEDQIKYFYEVKTLVSLSGGGLGNIFFMQPETNVIELQTDIIQSRENLHGPYPFGKENIYETNIYYEQQLHDLFFIITSCRNIFYHSIPNIDLQAETLLNKIKFNKALMNLIEE